MDYDCPLPAPGYLDEGAAGLVHDCPRVGGQRPAEEGGAQVHRHRGEPKHTIIQSVKGTTCHVTTECNAHDKITRAMYHVCIYYYQHV